LNAGGHFYVLALSQDEIRLFHGADDHDAKPLILQHFRRVDQALRELLAGDPTPVVLAGMRYLQAIYHQANTHPQLVPTGVDGSPRDTNPDQLHRQAWALVEPLLRSHETAAATGYRALQGTGRTSDTPGEVLAAARQGTRAGHRRFHAAQAAKRR
jgi:hypothetical protein